MYVRSDPFPSGVARCSRGGAAQRAASPGQSIRFALIGLHMADAFDEITRSRIMGRVKGKDTKPERLVRSALHRLGFRFRLHVAGLPGTPDIVLPRHRTVVFVNGCFWHGHAGCKRASLPKTRPEFWQSKISANKRRDLRSIRRLRSLGWRVITIWECRVRDSTSFRRSFKSLLD